MWLIQLKSFFCVDDSWILRDMIYACFFWINLSKVISMSWEPKFLRMYELVCILFHTQARLHPHQRNIYWSCLNQYRRHMLAINWVRSRPRHSPGARKSTWIHTGAVSYQRDSWSVVDWRCPVWWGCNSYSRSLFTGYPTWPWWRTWWGSRDHPQPMHHWNNHTWWVDAQHTRGCFRTGIRHPRTPCSYSLFGSRRDTTRGIL